MAILGKSKITELEVGTGQGSTSSSTGAQIVHGGLGVEENLHVGGNLSAGNIEQTLSDSSDKIPSSKAVYNNTIKSITADAEKVGANDPVEITVTDEGRNTNLHFKIPSGADGAVGKTLQLQADNPFFRVNQNGEVTEEQTINLHVIASNLTEEVKWNDPSIPAGTTDYSITIDSNTDNEQTYTVTADNLSSSVTIKAIKDGDSPYVLVPSTDNFVFSADSDGNIPSNEFTTIGSFQILYGSEEESLSDWSISSVFQPPANFGGTVTAEGQISVNKFLPASNIGYITITATKGDITVSRTLRCIKAKSGENPIILSLENDNYTFTVKGGTTPAIEDTLPQAVSGIRILEGNEEQTFSVGTGTGWVVSAVFTAVVNDSSSTDTSLFNGDIQSDGTVRVTTLSPTLQYGEIAITATNTELSQTLTSTVSIRLQKSAGFGTPTANATSLPMGQEATVSVSASGDETNKVFSFEFGIPKGDDPVFMSLNPDTIPVPCSTTGAILSSAFPLYTSVITYKGTEDVTSQWSYSANWSGTTANGSIDAQGNITITDYADIESTILTITATKIGSNPTETIEKGLLLYKARTIQGSQGNPGTPGANAEISSATASLNGDTSGGSPSITVSVNPVSGETNSYTFDFIFNNLLQKLYDSISTATNGAITPNAVRTALSQIGFSRAEYKQTIQANATLSTYVVPNYTAGQEIDVYYNGLYMPEGTSDEGGRYTINSSGTITFNTPLGGVESSQQLVVIARTLSSGGN